MPFPSHEECDALLPPPRPAIVKDAKKCTGMVALDACARRKKSTSLFWIERNVCSQNLELGQQMSGLKVRGFLKFLTWPEVGSRIVQTRSVIAHGIKRAMRNLRYALVAGYRKISFEASRMYQSMKYTPFAIR